MNEIDERDRRAFTAPPASTLPTLPPAFVTLLYAGLSPMACDSCNGQTADAFGGAGSRLWVCRRRVIR
ncbi:hypothetical protein AB0892_11745 [Streptomyces sp. NPDC005409]|uniref:hypothetical protein n=1 Tax=Streptomyces sp. NPDC005409 TaxID=3155342 RepID=UPI003456463F